MREQLLTYLESNGLKYKDMEHKILHQCINPLHDDKNISAFTDLLNGYTHCSSCKFHKSGVALIQFLGGEASVADLAIGRMQQAFRPVKEEQNLVISPPMKCGFDIGYRGISGPTFQKVGAYVAPSGHFYEKRIIFPLLDFQQVVKGFDAIAVDGREPKVLRSKGLDTTKFFGFEHLINGRDVFLCEGLFSALSFIEKDLNGIYNFGVGSIEKKLEPLFANAVRTVYLCGDNDDAGRRFNKEAFQTLKGSFKLRFWSWPKSLKEKGDSNDLQQLGKFGENIKYNKGD